MRRPSLLALALGAGLAGGASPSAAGAQSLLSASSRIAPTYITYKFKAPLDKTISEFALPVAVVVPLFSKLNVDLATAYARSEVKTGSATSSVSGLTDTQLRANYTFGNDALVLTLGLNLPTGNSTVSPSEEDAASAIASDFLVFPVPSLGTGLAATGGLAFARSFGSWNLGVGGSVRQSSAYEPFEQTSSTTPAVRFQPGNEYRARFGLDRTLGAGRLGFGLTYSTFGEDEAGSFTYNTGDRLIPQLTYVRPLGRGDLVLALWDLYRAAGKQLETIAVPAENIVNLAASTSFPLGGVMIEPNLELRNWTREGSRLGSMGVFGLRARRNVGFLTVIPSVSYSGGNLLYEKTTTTGTPPTTTVESQTVGLTGLRGTLTIRYVP